VPDDEVLPELWNFPEPLLLGRPSGRGPLVRHSSTTWRRWSALRSSRSRPRHLRRVEPDVAPQLTVSGIAGGQIIEEVSASGSLGLKQDVGLD
jgi:hypothetical protein